MNFYVMTAPGGYLSTQIAYGVSEEPEIIGDTGEFAPCPVCHESPGKLAWFPPHYISLSQRKYPDLLWASGTDLFASPEFRNCFENAHLSGITGYDPPATVTRVGRRPVRLVEPPPPEYRRVRLEGWGANLDDAASGARRPRDLCAYCRGNIDRIDRLVLQAGSWTGQDIFLARGLAGTIVVTERFRQMVEASDLRGMVFCPGQIFNFDLNAFHPAPKTEEEIARGYGARKSDIKDLDAQSPEPD